MGLWLQKEIMNKREGVKVNTASAICYCKKQFVVLYMAY